MQEADAIEDVLVYKARQLASELGSSGPFQEYGRALEGFAVVMTCREQKA